MALFDQAIVRLLPAMPRPVVRRISSRYIAGDHLPDATATVRALNEQGKLRSLLKVAFSPDGGASASQQKRVTLFKKLG